MKEICVLGIGNRLMMDDGIGVYVVEEIGKRNTNTGIQYIIGETDCYFCLDHIEKASFVIIVDAACFDKEPGTISTIPLELIFKNRIRPITVHDSHLLNELKIRGNSIKGVFIGIEPYEVNYCPNLSTNLQGQLIKIVKDIERIITSYAY